uniref:Kazal-like domain-containing protein n=1 Tax=Poecilia mexicana TaxID=48701 RepID=A0A3B3WEY8_9TELE
MPDKNNMSSRHRNLPVYTCSLSLQVCGSDGKTYRNECEIKNTKCLEKRLLLVQSQGPCAGRYFTHKHIQ